MTDVGDTLKRIQAHDGVTGVIIINNSGIPIRSTLEKSLTVQYAALLKLLCDKAQNVVKELSEDNDLTFLRIRSKKHEIMVAPDESYILIVIQEPTSAASTSA